MHLENDSDLEKCIFFGIMKSLKTRSGVNAELGCLLVRGTQRSDVRCLCVFTGEQTPSSVGEQLLGPLRKQGVDRWKLIEFPNFPFRGLKCSSARDPYHIETGAGPRPRTYACCGQHSQRDQQHAPFSRLTPDILWHDSNAPSLQAVHISAC